MIFEYSCERHGVFERDYPVGQAPRLEICPRCNRASDRYFGAPQIAPDPFRNYHLSSQKQHEQARQGRIIGGPQDKVEARATEKAQGVEFIGNETGGMSVKAREAIDLYKTKKRMGFTV